MKRITTSVAFLAFVAVLAAPFAMADAVEKAEKPEKIAHGKKVEIEDYLVTGKITVFDFTSEYCPPCRQISPMLDELHASRDDLAVVKVDINRAGIKGIDWQSPVARQYKLESVPHFKVYGADGKLMAEGDEATEMVIGWIQPK